uniref:Putative inhibitor of apoptosis 1 diap1 n=1 Tax=Ixodes ricinus TaxID=34613 RepID=A0A0K8R4J1_IXORI
MKLRFATNNTMDDVINMLVDDCCKADQQSSGAGRCDTDFMTMRTVMPMNVDADQNDEAIIDPAKSTTLKDHNDLIMKTFDTVPVPSTSRYYIPLQNSNPEMKSVGVMNIAQVVKQCMSNSRVDKRFMEIHRSTPAGIAELDRFFAQACTISPRNLGLFLQCLNFEMMDPELFAGMLQCLENTVGVPTPDEREISKYANDAMFRMAVNIFYHTRMIRSYKGDDVYMYDNMFFNNFLEWIQEENHMEHHIPPSVASSIMSWCTSMSTAMHTTRDDNGGTRYAMAALTTCEVDQRVLADFLNMFIKMYIEDETEVTIINKRFLENALLKVFESRNSTYHLAKGQFISPTALRLFLARCRWSIADDIRLMFPVSVKFLETIINDTTDAASVTNRETARRNMEQVNTMVAPLLMNPNAMYER